MHEACAHTCYWKSDLEKGNEARSNWRRSFHRWKWKNWAVQCGGKCSEQDMKKGGAKGTYHLWKPEVENSSDKHLALHGLPLKTGEMWLRRKSEKIQHISKLPWIWVF